MTRGLSGSTRGRSGARSTGSNRDSNRSNSGSNSNRVGVPTAPTATPTGSPSRTLPPRENEETSGEDARGAAPTGGSNPNDGWNSNSNSNLQPAAPTVERLGPRVEPDVVISAMGAASGGLVVLAGSPREMVAFGEAVRTYVEQGYALDRIIASTGHLQHSHWTQRSGRKALPGVRLAAPGHGGKPSILTELLAESETCPQCKGATTQRPAPAPLRAPIERISADAVRAALEALRSARATRERKESKDVSV